MFVTIATNILRALALALTAAAAGMLLPSIAEALTGTVQLQQKLSQVIKRAGSYSGAWVYDIDKNKVLFQWQAGNERLPASNEKVFTTATALAKFGPSYRIKTTVVGAGELNGSTFDGDIYIKGSGDPALSTRSFASRNLGQTTTTIEKLEGQLERLGIERVTGHVYGDESYFDKKRGVPDSGYRTSPYIGPLSALSFNLGYSGGGGFQGSPANFTATKFAAILNASGIKVSKTGLTGAAPGTSQQLASVESPTISKLVRRTNKYSDNFFAEMLIKGIGAKYGIGGSTAAGAAVVRSYVRESGGQVTVVDGSGLSRGNSTTPKVLGSFLLAVHNRSYYNDFYQSLPLAGVDGTLTGRMRSGAARGRVHAKTGTLTGVSSLSGYVSSRGGDQLAFSILMNGVNVYSARKLQDSMGQVMADYSGQ